MDDMIRGFYPDAHDIRNAFYLCLATTGWNPAVFLSLDVKEPFLGPHPKDSSRFILTGTKDRAQARLNKQRKGYSNLAVAPASYSPN